MISTANNWGLVTLIKALNDYYIACSSLGPTGALYDKQTLLIAKTILEQCPDTRHTVAFSTDTLDTKFKLLTVLRADLCQHARCVPDRSTTEIVGCAGRAGNGSISRYFFRGARSMRSSKRSTGRRMMQSTSRNGRVFLCLALPSMLRLPHHARRTLQHRHVHSHLHPPSPPRAQLHPQTTVLRAILKTGVAPQMLELEVGVVRMILNRV
jgi:hypothetical protein